MDKTEREISFNILNEIYNRNAFSNIIINQHLKNETDKRKENLVREIVYGVLENYIYIDYIISKASNIKKKKIHPKILIVLRIGIYQLLFMDNIPSRAAINESVNLAKKHGHRGSVRFVNGVLRNIDRNKEKFMVIEEKDDVSRISIKYSHPKWMVRRWVEDYGVEFAEKLSKANNETPKLNIRVNNLKTNKDKLVKSLEDYGFFVKSGEYAEDTLIIDNPTRINQLYEFKEGHFFIQDESSTLVGQIMDPKPGSTIIDLCSAPGGKATHLAEKMNNTGRIISKDIYEHKIRLINENSKRLGINIIESGISDALTIDKSLINKGDYVLVDAPCSGLGLIRRKPEIKMNKEEKDIKDLTKIQMTILINAKTYTKPGGILVYSTCTIEKEENINLIERFLNESPEFKLISIKDKIKNTRNLGTLDKGYIQLYPHIHNTDGFFVSKMIKER
ncbi:MAG TPA: 16S rRNA (cytosine(967)-C(5))-methyltransferase RsmB [Tissierellaceae bacterium]|nr:16S rRNA (cytosine(967)-C(5))-methyltransferase RsmB [Tissierellaceae bacterium]